MDLVARVIALHQALAAARLPHAFGGALALAWCTRQARGTIDIDLNVFVAVDAIAQVLAALPTDIPVDANAQARLAADGQVRLWWDQVPIDLFLNSTPLHAGMAGRAVVEQFAGHQIPFLSCRDLALLKACFNRTKDWADLEAMQEAGTLDLAALQHGLLAVVGADDVRLQHLAQLAERSTQQPGISE